MNEIMKSMHLNANIQRKSRKFIQINFYIILILLIILVTAILSFAQSTKLPSSDKIINDYLKVVGGRKRLASIKNTVYDWKVTNNGNSKESITMLQNPLMLRSDFPDNETDTAITATNGNTAWRQTPAGGLQTLTDEESRAFRLQALLAATRLTDLKNQRVAVDVIGRKIIDDKTTYIVEFAVRNGAKVRYFFDSGSKLPIKIENPATQYSACFSDYRQSTNGILEAHKIIEPCLENNSSSDFSTFELENVVYNTNLSSAVFDPPPMLENFDTKVLIEELKKNEKSMIERISEYGFIQKETEYTFDGKGIVKSETTKTYEVFPNKEGRRILKLISENGVPLSGEKLKKEEDRVVKEIEKSETEYARKQEKAVAEKKINSRAGENANASEGGIELQAIETILRVSEIYAPRFETFHNRDVIVFNFRPHVAYKPKDFFDAVFSKLAGTVWVDKAEKQIMRAETRVVENVKMGGGLMATFRKDSTIIFERAKFGEVWLPKLSRDNAFAKLMLFVGFDSATITEYSNYNHFSSEVKDSKLNDIEKLSPNQIQN